jgi:hypothetical protein
MTELLAFVGLGLVGSRERKFVARFRISCIDFGSHVLLEIALTVADLNSAYFADRLSTNLIACSGPDGTTAVSPPLFFKPIIASLNLMAKSV